MKSEHSTVIQKQRELKNGQLLKRLPQSISLDKSKAQTFNVTLMHIDTLIACLLFMHFSLFISRDN